MTRSLKKTTSPELQISPEQATNPAKSLRETSREMTYSDRGLPRRETNKKLIARYKWAPTLNARITLRALNNSSKIGQKNISFFLFSLSPWQIAAWGGGGGEGKLHDGKICIDNRGAPSLRPLKARDGDWTNGWVGERETNPVTITHHRCNLFFTTPKECLNYSIDKAAGPFSAWRRVVNQGLPQKVSARDYNWDWPWATNKFLASFYFPVTVLAY